MLLSSESIERVAPILGLVGLLILIGFVAFVASKDRLGAKHQIGLGLAAIFTVAFAVRHWFF